MRRIILKILVVSLTVMIGVMVAATWRFFRNRPSSLCSLAGNPARYDKRVVRVRGELYVNPNGEVDLNGIECGLRSNAWADVNFRERPTLIDDLRRLSAGDSVAKTQVVLTGRFEDRQRSCWTFQFEISDAELERASQISVVNFPEEIKKEDGRNQRDGY